MRRARTKSLSITERDALKRELTTKMYFWRRLQEREQEGKLEQRTGVTAILDILEGHSGQHFVQADKIEPLRQSGMNPPEGLFDLDEVTVSAQRAVTIHVLGRDPDTNESLPGLQRQVDMNGGGWLYYLPALPTLEPLIWGGEEEGVMIPDSRLVRLCAMAVLCLTLLVMWLTRGSYTPTALWSLARMPGTEDNEMELHRTGRKHRRRARGMRNSAVAGSEGALLAGGPGRPDVRTNYTLERVGLGIRTASQWLSQSIHGMKTTLLQVPSAIRSWLTRSERAPGEEEARQAADAAHTGRSHSPSSPPLPKLCPKSVKPSEEERVKPREEISSQCGDEDLCVVCLDRVKTHILLPCGHICMCGTCSVGFVGQLCPLCRQPCEGINIAYFK